MLMENHLRLLAEIEMLQTHRIKTENSILDYAKCIKYHGAGVNDDMIAAQKARALTGLQ